MMWTAAVYFHLGAGKLFSCFQLCCCPVALPVRVHSLGLSMNLLPGESPVACIRLLFVFACLFSFVVVIGSEQMHCSITEA